MKALKENCQKHTDGVVDADTYEQRENVRKLEDEGITHDCAVFVDLDY